MAGEWVGYATTGVVAVAGIWGTLRSTTRQISGQKEIAKLQIDAAKDTAREERGERRLEASYHELLVKVGEADDWAYDIWLNWSGQNQLEPVVLRPEIFVKTIRAQGVRSVYWSPRITQLVEELRAHIQRAVELWLRNRTATDALRAMEGSDEDLADLLARFMVEKNAISEIDHAVRAQVAAELAARHDGHAEPSVPA